MGLRGGLLGFTAVRGIRRSRRIGLPGLPSIPGGQTRGQSLAQRAVQAQANRNAQQVQRYANSIRVDVKVDASKAIQGFRRARREANTAIKRAQAVAAERTIIPEAESRVPSWAHGTIVARGRVRSQNITTTLRGTRGRTLGLLEYGGTVKGSITPKRKRALRTPHGVFAAVHGDRSYKPKRFLRGAVERRFTDYQEAMLPEVMKAFDDFPHTP